MNALRLCGIRARRLTVLVSLVVALASCQRDELSLELGEPVSSSGELNARLEASFTEALEAMNLGEFELLPGKETTTKTPDHVRISRTRVLVRFKRPLTTLQREQLHRYFEDMLAERANFDVGVTLDLAGSDHGATKAEDLQWQVEGKLDGGDLLLPVLEPVPAIEGKPTTFEVGCVARFVLKEGIVTDDFVRLPPGREMRTSFRDPQLQTLVDRDRMKVMTTITSLEAEFVPVEFRFDFGPAGEATKVIPFPVVSTMQEHDCESRIVQAGHPFDFFVGHSLSRVMSVEYRFADSAR